MITEKILKIDPYFKELKSADGFKCVSVKFPNDWVFEPSDRVNCAFLEKTGLIIFHNKEEDVSYDEIVDYINFTIIKNQEAQEKNVMLNEAIKNLSFMFSQKNLNELKKMDFSFNKVSKQKASKKNNKNIVEDTEIIIVNQEPLELVVTDEEIIDNNIDGGETL